MARPIHPPIPHHHAQDERPAHPAAGPILILLLAIIAAAWMTAPSVASLLPIHPPG